MAVSSRLVRYVNFKVQAQDRDTFWALCYLWDKAKDARRAMVYTKFLLPAFIIGMACAGAVRVEATLIVTVLWLIMMHACKANVRAWDRRGKALFQTNPEKWVELSEPALAIEADFKRGEPTEEVTFELPGDM